MHTADFAHTPELVRPDANLTGAFLQLVRLHQQSVFQITFGLLRDEIAAETIIRQVFHRVRRRLASGADAAETTVWLYHASLRFARRYYWKNSPPDMHCQLGGDCCSGADHFDLNEFVHVLALHPGKIEARDCELISLRHVLGLPLPQIGQLLRMHPYEISNRITWSRERVKDVIGGTRTTLMSPDAEPAFFAA